MGYQIITDSTADMNKEMFEGLPEVVVLPMEVTVGGEVFNYGHNGDLTIDEFYEKLNSGKFASTSQINSYTYTECFEKYLKEGQDILYLGFSSQMSGSYHNAVMSAEELKNQYPERKIICVDTLCASVGEGFLVCEAARKQGEGMEIDELAKWVEENKENICHWFLVDTFEHLRRGGRISGASAAVGTVLQIKPLLYVTKEGKLEVAEKPRGMKRAMKLQLQHLQSGWRPEENPVVVIGQGDAMDDAKTLKEMIKSEFPQANIYIADVGPVVGSHTGPGVLILAFWGTER